MKTYQLIMMSVLLGAVLAMSSAHAIEVTDSKGGFKSKLFEGKIYNDRGKYTGLITPEGKMYDSEGNFTGQIKNNAILNKDGSSNGFIRDGKIYDNEGLYKGQIKR